MIFFIFSLLLVVGGLCADVKRLTLWRNGGNNTKENDIAVSIIVNADDNFDFFKIRAGRKLGYVPDDCTPFSYARPRRPFHLIYPPADETKEPFTECNYDSYTSGLRVFDVIGRLLESLRNVEEGEELFVVPPGDHYFWPGGYINRRIELPYVLTPTSPGGDPVQLVTVSLNPRIFYLPRFTSEEERKWIEDYSRGRLVDSMGFGMGGKAARTYERTSTQTWITCNPSAPTVMCDVEKRIAAMLRLPYEHVRTHSDTMQVLSYKKGELYRSHQDWFDATQAPNVPGLREGYNRMITVFFWIQAPKGGGWTVFPYAGDPKLNPNITEGLNPYHAAEDVDFGDCERGIKVTPKAGGAVLWYNMQPQGNGHEGVPDLRALHGGCPPDDGEKLAFNKWIYNRNWAHRQQRDTWMDAPTPFMPLPGQSADTYQPKSLGAGDNLPPLSTVFSMGEPVELPVAKNDPARSGAAGPKGEVKVAFSMSAAQVTAQVEKLDIRWVHPTSKAETVVATLSWDKPSTSMNSYVGHEFRVGQLRFVAANHYAKNQWEV